MEDAVLPETEEQQRLYHSVSVVGTLLLQVVAVPFDPDVTDLYS